MLTIAPIKRPEVGSTLSASLIAALCHVFMALQDTSSKASTVKGSKFILYRVDLFSEWRNNSFERDASPASILCKSTAGRYRPVRVADGPITDRCRFIKNASWVPAAWKEETWHICLSKPPSSREEILQRINDETTDLYAEMKGIDRSRDI